MTVLPGYDFHVCGLGGHPTTPERIAPRVVAWFRRAQRDLPWRRTRDPYAIWISEIMAQQTRIATVIPYWERWMARFPDVATLAAAELDDVLALWSGLGYYSRARNLWRAAAIVAAEGYARLEELPGIGPYTAGAIRSIAWDEPVPAVDGNVKRVFARVFGTEEGTWELARRAVHAAPPAELNQGIMELGALVCTPTSPRCDDCPLASSCVARREGRVDELPAKRVKKAVPEQEIDVVWLARRGRVLLARRAPTGLFGGLWELPAAAALTGVTLADEVLARHTHKLTHRTFHYRVVRGRGAKPAWSAPYDAGRWVTLAAAADLALSSATRALLSSAHHGQER